MPEVIFIIGDSIIMAVVRPAKLRALNVKESKYILLL